MEQQLAPKTPGGHNLSLQNHEICKFATVTVKPGTGVRTGSQSLPRKGTQPSALETQRPWIGSYLLAPSVA